MLSFVETKVLNLKLARPMLFIRWLLYKFVHLFFCISLIFMNMQIIFKTFKFTHNIDLQVNLKLYWLLYQHIWLRYVWRLLLWYNKYAPFRAIQGRIINTVSRAYAALIFNPTSAIVNYILWPFMWYRSHKIPNMVNLG